VTPALAVASIVVLAVSAAPSKVVVGRVAEASPAMATGHSSLRHPLAVARTPSCRAVGRASGYANPLAGAQVKPERIDQGVDYAGTGTLGAVGDGQVTYVGTEQTGWPGAFIEYRLLDGPDAGCYVFYAEGVKPEPGVRAGDPLRAGQPVATIIQGWTTGIEIGWGAGSGSKTLAGQNGQWSPRDDAENIASDAGQKFSDLVAALGGPAGKKEG